MMLDTTNLLLTFAGINGALTCLTLWKISHEEAKKGRKLAWNLPFRNRRKPVKKRSRKKTHARTQHVKPVIPQKGVDILPPQYDLPRAETSEDDGPYLEGEWEVIT